MAAKAVKCEIETGVNCVEKICLELLICQMKTLIIWCHWKMEGTNDPCNIQLTCEHCNKSKGAK